MLEFQVDVTLSDFEEVGGKAGEGQHQGQKDADEENIGPESDHHVDETEHAHVDMEEGEGGRERRVGRRLEWVRRIVSDRGIEVRRQGGGESEPEGSEGSKHDKRESVA